MRALGFFLVLNLFFFQEGYSQTCTATKSGNWNSGAGPQRATWNCINGATNPNDASEVIIPFGYTVTISNDQSWNADVIVDGGTLIFSNKLSLGSSPGCGYTLIVINGGLIDDGSGPGANERLSICGNLIVTSQPQVPNDEPYAQQWPSGGFSNTGFGEFGEDNSLLPVDLLLFDAIALKAQILLTWKTASELNNDYFTLERSKDGINYRAIATIQGYGTTNEPREYKFADEVPFSGLSYYRLKQTDFDGTTETFRPVSVIFEGDRSSAKVYPNPLQNSELFIDLSASSFNSDVKLSIIDVSGAELFSSTLNTESLSGISGFDLSFLPKGAYVVNLNSQNLSQKLKLIKK